MVDHWQALRNAGAAIPRRSDIDPRRIGAGLEYAFIAERIAPGLARLRIAGTHLADLMGMEVRGMPLSAFVVPGDRDALADALTELFDGPAAVRVTLRAPGGPGRPALTGGLTLLPLRSDLGDVSRALGSLATEGAARPGRTPRRFGIVEISSTPLSAAAARAAGTAGVGSKAANLRPTRAPHLRLVTCDD